MRVHRGINKNEERQLYNGESGYAVMCALLIAIFWELQHYCNYRHLVLGIKY